MRYCLYHTTGHLPAAEMNLGDDSIIGDGVMNFKSISEVAQKKFGMTVHPDELFDN
jgi:hypothetical protein